mmetsp:Transcript_1398/g.4027  ORF Transcript_1398/g.4027 Transcript_1398/m.4027 type:complete len:244 (-) Transcript_1398:826-1557(-)
MTLPVNSLGHTMVARTMGSMTRVLLPQSTSSQSPGERISFSLISPSITLRGTKGFVAITLCANSSSSLCRKTSMWSRPKNPHLNPGPRAWLDSLWTTTLESFKVSFSMAFLRDSYSSVELGKMPPKHMDLMGLKPASASTGWSALCRVSPILMSAVFFIPVTRYPICPPSSLSVLVGSGHISPNSSTSSSVFVPQDAILSPRDIFPSMTLQRHTTPRNWSWWASKIRALKGLSSRSVSGGAIL